MPVLSTMSANRIARRGFCAAIGSSLRGKSYPQRRSQVAWRIDIADHARVADGNFPHARRVLGEQPLGAFVAAQRDESLVEAAGDADRMAAARAEIGRGERRSAG